ncbi:type II toxin-antitoxin system VapC family toxin [candidate division KSB1 bacterium]|nr:type II toxin-antitoxin system VapC family toxin [candidate division KSB1 bacterium]
MIILDTHVLLWLVSEQTKLTEKVKRIIQTNVGNLYVSSITAFVIAVKYKKEKLSLPFSPDKWFNKALILHGIDEITINSKILMTAASLPSIHNDPADRIIIASAMINNAKIISKDRQLLQYPDITVIWD